MSRGHSTSGRSGGFHSGGSFRSGGFHTGHHHTSVHVGFWWPALFLGRRTGSSDGSSSDNVKYKKIRNHLATAIAAGIFAVLCVMFIVFACKHTITKDYTIVEAKVTSVDYSYESYDEVFWFTSYDFDFNGEHISTESQLGWSQIPDIEDSSDADKVRQTLALAKANYYGRTFQIYVKNSDPYIIYEIEGKEDIPSPNAGYIVGAVFMGIIALIIGLVGINKYEVDKEAMAAATALKATPVPDGKRRCGYCGAIESSDASKCSNCGAPLK